jgi:hypothetical protein
VVPEGGRGGGEVVPAVEVVNGGNSVKVRV